MEETGGHKVNKMHVQDQNFPPKQVAWGEYGLTV